MSSKIELKPVKDLLGKNFFIPNYQRGYKWKQKQVEDLLNDLDEFKINLESKEGICDDFYCMQPLAVRFDFQETTDESIKIDNTFTEEAALAKVKIFFNKNVRWRVIDGQQRLTTMYLLLCYLDKSPYTIIYETRDESGDFLSKFKEPVDNNIENDSEKNVDFYHMYNVYKKIGEWFKDKDENYKTDFLNLLKEKVQFIWYETSEDEIEVFTRLNIGKIGLTNSELIKALILSQANFGSDGCVRQNEIANEWNDIEQSLQNDEFWLNVEKPFHTLSKGKLASNMFIKAVDHPYVGSKVKIIKETDNATYIAKFKDDGTFDDGDFKIMTGTDMHLYDVPEDVNKTLQMFANQVRDEKPDLIIFTGDVLLTKFQHLDTIQFAEFMEDLGVYWAYAFGNHEAREEKEYFKYFIFKGFADYPHCLCKFGDPELFGFGNYLINIMNSETELRQSLVLFDSGRDTCEPHVTNDKIPQEVVDLHAYDYIKPTQIAWYEKEIAQLKKEYGKVDSMLYMHIPIPEYCEVFDEVEKNTYAPSGKAEILYGDQFESVGCCKYNSGLFEAMKRAGSQAIFSGHDHVNYWAAKYDGVLLVYNQCGGYGCYNMYDYDNFRFKWDEKDWPQGYTITTVKKDGTIELRQSFNAKYL